MMRIQFPAARCFGLIAATSVAAVMAQSTKLPDAADPRATIPAVKYESAFSDYQPFREQKIRSWKEVNQEVADNPGMGSMGVMKDMPGMGSTGSMKDMPGMGSTGAMKDMPGMDSKASNGPKSKEGMASHNAGSMKEMPGMGSMGAMKAMPGMDSKAGNTPKSKEGTAGHNMGSMKDMAGMGSMGARKDMPGMKKEAPTGSMSKESHGAMAMAKPNAGAGTGQTAGVTGSGVVQGIDKANGKVKLTHDPIEALGWPKMTMFFRLKDGSLADQLKEGDRVEFSLEKSANGYVISSLQKGAPPR